MRPRAHRSAVVRTSSHASCTSSGPFGIVHRPRSFTSVPAPALVEDLRSLLTMPPEESVSDVTVVVNTLRLHLHRCILAARCPYFRSMFSRGMREARAREVHLTDISPRVFQALCEYMCVAPAAHRQALGG